MDIVIDASAILAVIVDEPERNRVIEMTTTLHYKYAHQQPVDFTGEDNRRDLPCAALLTTFWWGRARFLKDALRGLSIFQSVPIRYLAVDLENAVSIAHANNLYAYDAYFLDCASRHALPLLTLDRSLGRAAERIGVHVLEI